LPRGFGIVAALLAGAAAASEMRPIAHELELARLDPAPGIWSSATLQGHVALVTFWTSWCPPRALARVGPLARELAPRGLRAVAINLDERDADARAAPRVAWAEVASLRDGDAASARAFGVDALPVTYLVGCDGSIRARYAGRRGPDPAALRASVEALLLDCAARLDARAATAAPATRIGED
jgi:cytochrome c biogenesis protein CcmG, thiol:disulfide interchange protein DsbE